MVRQRWTLLPGDPQEADPDAGLDRRGAVRPIADRDPGGLRPEETERPSHHPIVVFARETGDCLGGYAGSRAMPAQPRGRVRRWRGVCRVRCVSRRLSRRHSVRLPWIRFHPLPSELYVRIARIQLSSGIMHLAHEAPVQSSFQPCQSPAVPVGMAPARFQKSHASIRVAPPRHAAEPVHAPTAPDPVGPAPSLTHVTLPDSPPFHAGLLARIAHHGGVRRNADTL